MFSTQQMMAIGRGIQGIALCNGPCFSSTLITVYPLYTGSTICTLVFFSARSGLPVLPSWPGVTSSPVDVVRGLLSGERCELSEEEQWVCSVVSSVAMASCVSCTAFPENVP